MDKIHHVSDITFNATQMAIKIDGKKHIFYLKNISSRLLHATPAQRKVFKVSPSGYGIHWPLIDEDISVAGLLVSQTSLLPEAVHH